MLSSRIVNIALVFNVPKRCAITILNIKITETIIVKEFLSQKLLNVWTYYP